MTGEAPDHTSHDGEKSKKSTKRDRIVLELRRMIQAGELPRGSRVQQDPLAEQFKTSITPVREALRLLEAEGLLVSEPHRGVRVADADYDQIKSVYLQRMLLETYAMKRSVRRLSPRDLDVAQTLIDNMQPNLPGDDEHPIPTLNRRFHFLFYERSGNAGLTAQIELLWQQWPWDLLEVIDKRASSSSGEHQAIVDAARAVNVDAVAVAAQKHLSASFMDLAVYLTGTTPPDPFELDND
jgi:DNA-binding GntR family transcriptional regulator